MGLRGTRGGMAGGVWENEARGIGSRGGRGGSTKGKLKRSVPDSFVEGPESTIVMPVSGVRIIGASIS